MALVVGVDSSTQSTTVVVVDTDTATTVSQASAPHPSTQPPVSEQDPAAWWQALCQAMAQVPAALRRDVAAVSVAGQQHGLVVTDAAGVPLRPAVLWNDTTSTPEARRLVEALGGPEQWARQVGSVPVAAFTVTKLARLVAIAPDVADGAAHICCPHDWLTFRLTGRWVTDRGDASGTGWWDPATGAVDGAVLELVDATRPWRQRLPEVLGPNEVAGTLTDAAVEDLGLSSGVVVGPGTGDNMAAALGVGLAPGQAVVSLGTSGTVYARTDSPTADPTGAVAGFADATGGFLPLVCTLNATKVTDAVSRWIGADHDAAARLGGAVPPGANGVVVVPYFDGERTPDVPDARGALFGITPGTQAGDLVRAAHEGVAGGLLAGLDALGHAGVVIDDEAALLVVGGGSRSALARQCLADLSGRTVAVPDVDEAVAAGAARQAAAVIGAASIDGGSVAVRHRTEPAPDADAEALRARYRRWAAVVVDTAAADAGDTDGR